MTDFVQRTRAARLSARRPFPRLLALLALVAGILAPFAPAAAQSTLNGRVVRAGGAVPNVAVELHRVATDTSGMIATGRADAQGNFRFDVPRADTAAGFTVFFATAMVDGVRYFGPALHPGEPGTGYQVVVYDTTSARTALDSLRVSRRDVIVIPGQRGGWEVAEVVRVQNPTGRTVVGPEGRPAFGMAMPRGATDFETEEPGVSEVADREKPQDLVLMGDEVRAIVPLTPGGRDFFFRYRLPARTGTLNLPLSRRTDTLAVYVRQPAPGVEVEGLPTGEPFEAEGEQFLRYTGTALAPGRTISVRNPAHRGSPVDPRLAGGIAAGLVLAAGVWFALRRRPPTAPTPA
ncbi:hypothetical protein [Longimicrobium sp.]|uniref:hypothetical protein n=1 Tax=Longimicrobium sp. TaxID=2029185 RepID=UPI002E37A81C|nr:hypothetical protein [Longimicrobium sp.]HEX6037175.1 hypothetical protein [Longimicrobium sp.]